MRLLSSLWPSSGAGPIIPSPPTLESNKMKLTTSNVTGSAHSTGCVAKLCSLKSSHSMIDPQSVLGRIRGICLVHREEFSRSKSGQLLSSMRGGKIVERICSYFGRNAKLSHFIAEGGVSQLRVVRDCQQIRIHTHLFWTLS